LSARRCGGELWRVRCRIALHAAAAASSGAFDAELHSTPLRRRALARSMPNCTPRRCGGELWRVRCRIALHAAAAASSGEFDAVLHFRRLRAVRGRSRPRQQRHGDKNREAERDRHDRRLAERHDREFRRLDGRVSEHLLERVGRQQDPRER